MGAIHDASFPNGGKLPATGGLPISTRSTEGRPGMHPLELRRETGRGSPPPSLAVLPRPPARGKRDTAESRQTIAASPLRFAHNDIKRTSGPRTIRFLYKKSSVKLRDLWAAAQIGHYPADPLHYRRCGRQGVLSS